MQYLVRYAVILSVLSNGVELSFAQEQMLLTNPSFEGIAGIIGSEQVKNFLTGWFDCNAFPNESPPEIHSASTRVYEVNHAPKDGKTFISLVVREKRSWECIGQKLEQPLIAGESYQLDLYACQAETFMSPTISSIDPVAFNVPVILRVWGGRENPAGNEEMSIFLGKSNSINHHDWKKYSFQFIAEQEIQYIVIEAYYSTPTEFPYNGHVLVDNASLIKN